MSVSYGLYQFPEPTPSVAIGDEMIYVAGELDHSKTKITLVGLITGANLISLYTQKKAMTEAFFEQYKILTVDGNAFSCCKPDFRGCACASFPPARAG